MPAKKPTNDDVIASLEQQIADLTEALQRERADSMNVRRHHDAQMAGLSNTAKASVVKDLLPALDTLERSLKHVPKELEGNDYVKGIQGVVKQFEKALANIGVVKIKTLDEVFDPSYHEAISLEAGEGSQEIVSEELQPGYMLGDQVIRHAMVKVVTR
jgi:molecular chaperone GrpE